MSIPNIFVTGEEALICVEFGMRFYVSEVMETWNTYSAPQSRNFAFLFTKISKLIKLSRGRSSVYSAKFRKNDRLISYEEDKIIQRCRKTFCVFKYQNYVPT